MHKARSIAYERIIDAHIRAHIHTYIYIHTICDVCISTGYMTIKSLGDAVVSRNVFRYSFIWFICNSNAFIKCNNRLNIVAWRMLRGKTPFCTPQYPAFIRKHTSIKSELQTETFARVINREEYFVIFSNFVFIYLFHACFSFFFFFISLSRNTSLRYYLAFVNDLYNMDRRKCI